MQSGIPGKRPATGLALARSGTIPGVLDREAPSTATGLEPGKLDHPALRDAHGPGLPTLCLLAAVAAGLTIWLQGFVFGWSNNIFQVPFVEGWFDQPAFAEDVFVQTLRYFASWVWSFAALAAPVFGTEKTFFGLQLASRFLMLLTAALLMRQLGLRSLPGLAMALLAMALTDALHQPSRVGGHDLYFWFFTHSSLIWPPVLLSLLWMSQGRVVAAVASNGVTFGVNGFIAVSHGVGLAAGALGLLPLDGRGRLRLAGRWLMGLGLALLVGLPTLLWVYGMLATQPPAPEGFNGRDFLYSYWPEHWWVSAATWREQLWAVGLSVAGLLALVSLGAPARVLLAAYLGYVTLFALAGLLPHLTTSLTLLNIHPLRVSSGLVTMVATIAVVTATVRELLAPLPGGTAAIRRVAAGFALLCLAWGSLKGVLLAMAALGAILVLRRLEGGSAPAALSRLLARVDRSLSAVPRYGLLLALVCGGLLAALVPIRHAQYAEARTTRAEDTAAMRQVGLWLRANTPERAMIFIPGAAEPPHSHNIQVWAQRRFWYDWKRGGAVQWSPHYHAEWHERRMEARALTDVKLALSYACTRGIDYLVETPDRMAAAVTPPPGIVLRTPAYTVIQVRPSCVR